MNNPLMWSKTQVKQNKWSTQTVIVTSLGKFSGILLLFKYSPVNHRGFHITEWDPRPYRPYTGDTGAPVFLAQ